MNKNTKRERYIYIIIAISLAILLLLVILGGSMYSKQWNWHGVSKIPNIECMDNSTLESVGNVGDADVYQYGIKNVSYQTILAKKIDIKDYCEKEWLSEELLTEGGVHITRNNCDLYQFENFYILTDDNAIVFCNNDSSPTEVIKALERE